MLLKEKTGCLKKWLSIFYLTTCICAVLVRFFERKRQYEEAYMMAYESHMMASLIELAWFLKKGSEF